MSGTVGSLDNSYFSPLSNVASEIAKESSKKSRTEKTGKLSFQEIFKKNISQSQAQAQSQAGFPPEIESMSISDALVFLKDRIDEAGERLAEDFSAESFAAYRKSINQFIKYVVKNNFEIEKKERKGIDRRTRRPYAAKVLVQEIDKKINQFASDMLLEHLDKIKMLARVNEIQGLVVDLLAA